MAGKLYGIGVGPGDSGLVTLKARRILDRCDIIAYPVKVPGEGSVAFDIVRPIVDMEGKRIEEFVFSMDPDDSVRMNCRSKAIDRMCALLDQGNDIAMVTLGDVGVYSTYMYIDQEIRERGYETDIVPGIPSFCHGASVAGLPLMIGNEGLAIVPVAKENSQLLGNSLDNFDNIVVMKAFKSIPMIAKMMDERGIDRSKATVISNVGMPGEYVGPMDLTREYGYFTTVLIKKR
ncbi:MAG: precorrin-2 C(20)-methyltransferase [Candidatus Methanomethylophilaceae archaeon]|nr:precorrin-2 C(20)-methyltransferase [Candidatus Methanomethylophilaceae archaeon]MBQ7405968.1 precorrin-2 C(20)-methyltransferase [Candidatus Methanomethylophilaceae archaeon]MBQ8644050.1 precorrin-2 C(20)-methyltransferase [Candidatus Methanomethylophilaceae archaeon]MBR2347952.1 precorrin-2 C(20)-methyltransferase [Candidatus Methanomethylophilaceae archaeon]